MKKLFATSLQATSKQWRQNGLRRSLATAVTPPALSATLPDPVASMGVAPSLYNNYTSGRWLYNESQQMALRTTPFHVRALFARISWLFGADVVHVDKREGLFNKSFIVTLSSGMSLVARVKNSIAGPAHYTTASEVATMDYCRRVLGMPVPQVYDWSSRADENGMGCEYILMEKTDGVQLSTVWRGLQPSAKRELVNSLVDTEKRLLATPFSHHGGLYYKADVPAHLQASTLYGDPEMEARRSEVAEFCIGPTPVRAYYENERTTLDIDRGPWLTCEDYLASIATREEAWIAHHAKPNAHDDPFSALGSTSTAAEHLAALTQYRQLVPRLAPPRTAEGKARASVLWHPDLNTGNVFVSTSDDAQPRVSGLIDWQGCWAGPAYLQLALPAFLEHAGMSSGKHQHLPVVPPGLGEMSEQSQYVLMSDHRARLLHRLYELRQLLPYRVGEHDVRTIPVRIAGNTWRNGVLPLKLALRNAVEALPEEPSVHQTTASDVEDAEAPVVSAGGENVEDMLAERERYVDGHVFSEYVRSSFSICLHGWTDAEAYEQKKQDLDDVERMLDPEVVEGMAHACALPSWWPSHDSI
ncbi:hypothetical protein FISHEDRAFT_66475 [Fistulina hepatica ATCC 64428]|uniref:Aminoglycoside phosphotransferase domain-containing protein n=1 Tax=Fistulina hepatica ATCC 64428 TaxID=1128425 RepID=A0A0D7A8Y7_9AGAR|nr:hypothetical protein FISHEDRAFT_66475 [Fistulina hepatica ATCC 64428]